MLDTFMQCGASQIGNCDNQLHTSLGVGPALNLIEFEFDAQYTTPTLIRSIKIAVHGQLASTSVRDENKFNVSTHDKLQYLADVSQCPNCSGIKFGSDKQLVGHFENRKATEGNDSSFSFY